MLQNGSLLLVIPLPDAIRNELERICCGLPGVDWADPTNLCLKIRHLGHPDVATEEEIEEKLQDIVLPPFPIALGSVDCTGSPNKKGSLWIPAKPSDDLTRFEKRVDQALKSCTVDLSTKKTPYVHLGTYQKLQPTKLANYFESNFYFYAHPFDAAHFQVVKLHLTDKRAFFEEIATYPFVEED